MATIEHGTTHRDARLRTASDIAETYSLAITPGLARRLAAAADSVSGDGALYVLASYTDTGSDQDPYDVTLFHGPNALQDAIAQMNTLGANQYGVFGPYAIPSLSARVAQAIVDEVGAIVIMPDGTRIELMGASGSRYDTLFWTASSVRKFALPYYAQLYSPEFAARVMERFESETVPLMVHMPWTEYAFLENPLIDVADVAGVDVDRGSKPLPGFFELHEDGTYRAVPMYPRRGESGAA